MSESVKEGEVVVEQGLVPAKGGMRSLIKEQDIPVLEVMETMDSLDWRNLKPHQTALILMQKPMQSGGGTIFLSFRQAILFATRCYELGISPFGSEVWFDPNRASVNLTLEGKRQVARNRGIDLGPPQFEEMSREWKDIPRETDAAKEAKKLGFNKDIGIRCKMRVGDPSLKEYATYDAWLSEWFVHRSPVWQAKPYHMLQTRAAEKCVSMAMGTGASESVNDE